MRNRCNARFCDICFMDRVRHTEERNSAIAFMLGALMTMAIYIALTAILF
jgi:hypothetical protein